MKLTRRQFCESTGSLALATAVFGVSALLGPQDQAWAQSVDTAELMKPSPLGEMKMGNAKAPVTIIEYASMTCSHCAAFAKQTMPELKKRYIDTGKVHYILREFPLDPLAAAGFMLARCAAKDNADKYFALVDTLFVQQNTWVVQKPLEPLKAIAKQAGLSEQEFEACLANQKLLDGMETVRKQAADKLGVNSTPTFFVNGNKHPGALSIDEMAKLIQPYLKEG